MPEAALSIAGSDPSGGAGIQADIKTFALMGVYGMAVPAALTVQNTRGVISVKALPPKLIIEQINAIFDDIRPGAVKTGMLLNAATVGAVAATLRERRAKNIVVDPVMVSSSGKRLLKKDAVGALTGLLFPLAALVTPNVAEAALLSGIEIKNVEDAKEAARRIRALGPRAVLVKGGHLPGAPIDVLFDGRTFTHYTGRRVGGKDIHGAGCVLSAAVTAGLAKGLSLRDAVAAAKGFVSKAIKKALPVGEGRAPLV
ncbi:MAG TPA: bifunctional hydroxymethylpyrimidine kinase/phosphomethylpyrimidine kinase [Nitrospirota bacterium]|nr:bifunctional hydroxymethylpyrimidine kinase/phosphomethylpyrimidine kinase [Nitrospirota bacterium]